MRRAKVLTVMSSVAALGAFAAVGFIPRDVCGCISPDMRFRRLFGVSAGQDAERARSAVLARLPVGTAATQIHAACVTLNDSVVRTACTTGPAQLACSCAFRTESSLLGWYERHVTLKFWVDSSGSLTAVDLEASSSLF